MNFCPKTIEVPPIHMLYKRELKQEEGGVSWGKGHEIKVKAGVLFISYIGS